jgi:hypothetical protein
VCLHADFVTAPPDPGSPENADLAGLPKSYIIQQMADYKSGARGTALPGRTPPKLMIELSRIVEVPDDLLRFESRDPRSTFTAYAPIGSLAKGEALVM